MNTLNKKKAYIFKMNMIPANILSFIILVVTFIIASLLLGESILQDYNSFVLIVCILGYFALHEFLHGVGYFLGGCKLKNIQFGICLEKGIFYAMAYQKITKKNILISLQMPFMIIGVITLIISTIFKLPLLALLSVINFSGASIFTLELFVALQPAYFAFPISS